MNKTCQTLIVAHLVLLPAVICFWSGDGVNEDEALKRSNSPPV